MPATQKRVYFRLDTGCGPTLYKKCHNHNTPGKRHNNTWVEPLTGNCSNSFTRQTEQVWQKCKIQKNWCTVTVAPTIKHQGGNSRSPGNKSWYQVPEWVSVSCLASHIHHECARHNNGYIWRLDTRSGPTLYRKCHSHNTPGKRHNNTWVEPLAENCTNSSRRQREQVWQKCKIQKNWCTVTVAPTIEHLLWTFTHPWEPELRPGAREESASPSGLAAPSWMRTTQERLYMEAWHWMWTDTIKEVSQPQHTRKKA